MLSFDAPASILRRQLAPHSAWVEGRLGAPLEDCVLFELGLPLAALALDRLTGSLLWRGPHQRWPALVDKIAALDFAEGAPLLDLEPVDMAQLSQRRWSGTLRNAAFCLRFHDLDAPLVILSSEQTEPTHNFFSTRQRQLAVCLRAALPQLLHYFHTAMTHGRKRVRVFGGEDFFLPSQSDQPYSWDDVLLDEARQSLVRLDFEHFLERREWFAARRLPWRRGYLFHGPPGNGKTSAVRAMASHPDLSVFSIDFTNDDVDDYDLTQMFEAAAEYSPGLVVLEDFDRIFGQKSEREKSECSFSHLLNCLDGLSHREGTIVVGTANHPEHLDDSILRRPGRFDRVVEFPLPNAVLRHRYLSKLCPGLDVTPCAAASERMSFAQLREVWLLASQLAFASSGDLTALDLEGALAQIQREQSGASRSRIGFLRTGLPEERESPAVPS